MSRTAIVLSLFALLSLVARSEATILTNGTLETWTTSTNAASWTEIGTVTQVSGQNSPFTDVAPLGSNAGTISNSGSGGKVLSQTFTSQTGALQNIVEFKFDTLPTNGEVYHWSLDDNATNTIFRLSLGANFGKFTNNQSGVVEIMPLSAGTWYQVFVDVDFPNQEITGAIRPFGGSFTPFSQPFSDLDATSAGRALSPAWGFLASGASPNQPIVFDNLYLGATLLELPPPPIPEPSSLALISLLGGFALLRKKSRSQA